MINSTARPIARNIIRRIVKTAYSNPAIRSDSDLLADEILRGLEASHDLVIATRGRR